MGAEDNMTIGWLTNGVTDADTFFLTKRLKSTAWDALTVTSLKDEKTAVLNMAYDRLRFCKDFEIPAIPTAVQLERLALAQLETSYYLAGHLADEDRRKGLQAQGVDIAGIVKEQYADAYLSKLPLPAIVYDLLEDILSVEVPFYISDIDRDEEKGANEKVTDF